MKRFSQIDYLTLPRPWLGAPPLVIELREREIIQPPAAIPGFCFLSHRYLAPPKSINRDVCAEHGTDRGACWLSQKLRKKVGTRKNRESRTLERPN